MEITIKNTKFDNLVNYESQLYSNSSQPSVDFESSADPTSLASLMKNNQLIQYSILNVQEKTIQHTEIEKVAE